MLLLKNYPNFREKLEEKASAYRDKLDQGRIESIKTFLNQIKKKEVLFNYQGIAEQQEKMIYELSKFTQPISKNKQEILEEFQNNFIKKQTTLLNTFFNSIPKTSKNTEILEALKNHLVYQTHQLAALVVRSKNISPQTYNRILKNYTNDLTSMYENKINVASTSINSTKNTEEILQKLKDDLIKKQDEKYTTYAEIIVKEDQTTKKNLEKTLQDFQNDLIKRRNGILQLLNQDTTQIAFLNVLDPKIQKETDETKREQMLKKNNDFIKKTLKIKNKIKSKTILIELIQKNCQTALKENRNQQAELQNLLNLKQEDLLSIKSKIQFLEEELIKHKEQIQKLLDQKEKIEKQKTKSGLTDIDQKLKALNDTIENYEDQIIYLNWSIDPSNHPTIKKQITILDQYTKKMIEQEQKDLTTIENLFAFERMGTSQKKAIEALVPEINEEIAQLQKIIFYNPKNYNIHLNIRSAVLSHLKNFFQKFEENPVEILKKAAKLSLEYGIKACLGLFIMGTISIVLGQSLLTTLHPMLDMVGYGSIVKIMNDLGIAGLAVGAGGIVLGKAVTAPQKMSPKESTLEDIWAELNDITGEKFEVFLKKIIHSPQSDWYLDLDPLNYRTNTPTSSAIPMQPKTMNQAGILQSLKSLEQVPTRSSSLSVN